MDPEECRANARECYDVARNTADPEARRELLLLVAQWHEVAYLITKDRRKLH